MSKNHAPSRLSTPPLRRRWLSVADRPVDVQGMAHRRVVLGSLSFGFGLLALFPPAASSAAAPTDHDDDGFRSRARTAVALVGRNASGQHDEVVAIPKLRHDAESGRTSFAFTDDRGTPIAPPASER